MVMTVVFAAGAVVGAVVALRCVHSNLAVYRAEPERLAVDMLPRLRANLSLDERQSAQVSEILSRRHGRIVAAHRAATQEVHEEFAALERDIADVLDEQQRYRWHEIAARVRRLFLPRLPR